MLAQQPRQLTPASIIAVLRDHYEGTPYDLTNGYKKGSPHQTDERTLCSANTEVSVVCQTRSWLPAEIGAITWRAMATPCTSVFTPWYYGNPTIPEAFKNGTNLYTENSAYWTFRDLSRYADVRYQSVSSAIHKRIALFEQKEFAAQPQWEQEALRLYGKDKQQAIRFLAETTNNLATQSVQLGDAMRRQ